MNCINQIFGLFEGSTRCAATGLAVLAFVAGLLVMCLVCRLFRPCGRKGTCPTSVGKTGVVGQPSVAQRRPFTPVEKRHPAPADGSIEIYVGNLSYDMTDDQLRKEFEVFGKVNSAHVIINRHTGRSKGFGFVHMPNRAEVDAAVKALSEKEILGRRIRCNVSENVG